MGTVKFTFKITYNECKEFIVSFRAKDKLEAYATMNDIVSRFENAYVNITYEKIDE